MVDITGLAEVYGFKEVLAKGTWLIQDVQIPILKLGTTVPLGYVVLSAGLGDGHPEVRIEWVF